MFQQLNAEGITVILVTHDPDVAAFAHRTIHISDGLIAGDDSRHAIHREQGLTAIPAMRPVVERLHGAADGDDDGDGDGNGHDAVGQAVATSDPPALMLRQPLVDGLAPTADLPGSESGATAGLPSSAGTVGQANRAAPLNPR